MQNSRVQKSHFDENEWEKCYSFDAIICECEFGSTKNNLKNKEKRMDKKKCWLERIFFQFCVNRLSHSAFNSTQTSLPWCYSVGISLLLFFFLLSTNFIAFRLLPPDLTNVWQFRCMNARLKSRSHFNTFVLATQCRSYFVWDF